MAIERQSIEPTYDHQETGDRFTVEVREGAKRVSIEPLRDPFIHTTIRPRGLRQALRVLLGRYEVAVHVSGDAQIVEDVCELDADYLGLPRSTRRREWNEQLERGLAAFAPKPPASPGENE